MKILIVDNGTSYLKQLQSLIAEHACHTVSYFGIDNINLNSYDLVVLSGGHDFPVLGNENKLEKEISLIKNSNIPIFGICFGFELIAHTFGAQLKTMDEKENGMLNIEVLKDDKIFSGIKTFDVFESHRWVVSEAGPDLEVLAVSKDGAEVIKHKVLPIYGVQFHPEMFSVRTYGDEIFKNFLQTMAPLR